MLQHRRSLTHSSTNLRTSTHTDASRVFAFGMFAKPEGAAGVRSHLGFPYQGRRAISPPCDPFTGCPVSPSCLVPWRLSLSGPLPSTDSKEAGISSRRFWFSGLTKSSDRSEEEQACLAGNPASTGTVPSLLQTSRNTSLLPSFPAKPNQQKRNVGKAASSSPY